MVPVPVFLPLRPLPPPAGLSRLGISAVHFLEGVNYLAEEHICQQAEGAASVCVPGGGGCKWAPPLLPAPWRLSPGLQPPA